MPGRPLTAAPRLALFGKLPAHGDFVRRGDPALVLELDAWLTGQIERLARRLDDAYDIRLAALSAWSFTLPGGLAGVLAASHDRTGRVFPIVVLIEGRRPRAAAAAAALVEALAGGLDADALQAVLLRLPADAAEPDLSEGARWWRPLESDQAAFTVAGLPEGADFVRLVEGVA